MLVRGLFVRFRWRRVVEFGILGMILWLRVMRGLSRLVVWR